MIPLYEVFGCVGNLFFVVGMFCIAKKCRKMGFSCNFLGNIIYSIVGTLSEVWALLVLSVLLGIINAYGFINDFVEDR